MSRLRRRSPVALAPGGAVGCVSSTDGRFRNNYPHPEKTGFWKWKWEQWRDGLPHRPEGGYRFEVVKSDFSPALNPSVTWIGHATVLLRVGGLSVLTDPQFSERASPFSFAGPKRVVPTAPGLDALPHIVIRMWAAEVATVIGITLLVVLLVSGGRGGSRVSGAKLLPPSSN